MLRRLRAKMLRNWLADGLEPESHDQSHKSEWNPTQATSCPEGRSRPHYSSRLMPPAREK